MKNNNSPDDVFAQLMSKNPRTAKNLKIIHDICRKVSEGDRNFAPANIGRLSQKEGGPKLNTLYSPLGKKFRDLMSAWEAAFPSNGKRTALAIPTKLDASLDDIVNDIEDITKRTRIRIALGELGRLRRAVQAAHRAGNGKITEDMRPKLAQGQVQIFDAPARLTDSELSALKNLTDPDWLKSNNLSEGPRGELVQNGKAILPVGTISGVRTLIEK